MEKVGDLVLLSSCAAFAHEAHTTPYSGGDRAQDTGAALFGFTDDLAKEHADAGEEQPLAKALLGGCHGHTYGRNSGTRHATVKQLFHFLIRSPASQYVAQCISKQQSPRVRIGDDRPTLGKPLLFLLSCLAGLCANRMEFSYVRVVLNHRC